MGATPWFSIVSILKRIADGKNGSAASDFLLIAQLGQGDQMGR
jgi:hypothetical protein